MYGDGRRAPSGPNVSRTERLRVHCDCLGLLGLRWAPDAVSVLREGAAPVTAQDVNRSRLRRHGRESWPHPQE